MHVLALDTTTRAGSAALVTDDRVAAERTGDPARTHAERLPGDLLAVVADAGLRLADVDALAVAIGPGGFTGLRIGIATIQGLAFVLGRPVVPISALEALATAAAAEVSEGTVVAAWLDAHRGEVFSAAYRVAHADQDGVPRIVEVEGPSVDRPEAIARRWRDGAVVPQVVIGDGAVLYAAHLEQAAAVAAPPLAPILGRIARRRLAAGGGGGPAAIQPLYVRRPDAEIARERGAAPVTVPSGGHGPAR